MYTARIVVLTIALSAGGGVAYPASGSDNKPAPAQPVAQLQTADIVRSEVILSNIRVLATDQAPKEKDGQNAVVGNMSDDQALRRGGSINVARYGVSSPTTTQK